MKASLSAVVIVGLLLSLHSTAIAGEPEDQIIRRVVNTYGGTQFERLKSLTIRSDLRSGGIDQGYSAGHVELLQNRKILTIDLVNRRGAVELWGGPQNPVTMRLFNMDDGVGMVWYDKNEYRLEREKTFSSQFGGEIRASDTLLAYELMARPDAVTYQRSETYLGLPHDVLQLAIPDWPVMTVFVDHDTGHITKMVRQTENGVLTYLFGDFAITDGVTYANDFSFYIGDFLSEYAKSRTIEVNKVRARTFELEEGLREEGVAVDQSTMRVDAVSERVYHVGQTSAYTTFIEADNYVIAVGGTAGFKDRYQAYKTDRGSQTKPLRYMIISHHHGDHLAGIKDAHDLGATLVSPQMAVQRVLNRVGNGLKESDILVLNHQMTLGPVDIHDIATAHVGSFALVYVPVDKTVIQVDHYGGYYKNGPSAANRSAATLKNEIDRLDLDVEVVLSGHHRKAESYKMFLTSLKKYYRSGPCPTGRAICQ